MASWEDSSTNSAAEFGWSLSVINSDPDLKKLFAQAKKENWTTTYFIAKVRDTKWFKTHSDTYRQALILRNSDPATYKQNVANYVSQISALAGQMGATGLTGAQLNKLGEQAFWFGWNQDQLRQHLVGFVGFDKGGNYYSGDAATAQSRLTEIASQYGISVAPDRMGRWVKDAVMGKLNEDEVQLWAIEQASSRYPSLASRLKAGETLMDIANPYIQSYAQTLEVNGATIGLNDPLIQSALSFKDDKGQPTTKTVWQFEQDLRNDPRYMKTQQAQDRTMAVAHQVLRDFGLTGN